MVLRTVLALAVLGLPALAPAATIRGRVDVRLEARQPQPRPNVAALGMASRPADAPAPDRTRSVVYLDTAPSGAFERAEPGRARMLQQGEAFLPYVLPVRVGTVVDFPNRDPLYHNVFSLSKARPFDLGRYASGKSKSVRFDEPGIVRVFCDIHSHMSAYVLVFAHRFFTATGDDGSYALDGVPPGHYTLVVWTNGRERHFRQLHVPDAGSLVEADFVVE